MKSNTKSRLLLVALTIIFIIATSLVLVVTASVSKDNIAYAYEYSGGIGTSDDPYIIGSLAELMDFAADVNGGNTSLCAKLNVDVTLDISWIPIGTSSNKYNGEFDGQGRVITYNVYYESTEVERFALFGYLGSSAVVRNIQTEGSIQCNILAAAIATESAGKIEKCINRANITSIDPEYNVAHDGIVFYSTGIIDQCANEGTIHGGTCVGGVCGQVNGGIISNCYNVGALSIRTDGQTFGGVAGQLNAMSDANTAMTNCFSTANITYDAASEHRWASLVGTMLKATINHSYYQNGDEAVGHTFSIDYTDNGIAKLTAAQFTQ